MRKKGRSTVVPDIKEFTDTEGTKWVQTSTDDIFSIKELNDILESIERDEKKEEVVLARIDFQKVNKEYYDAAVELQQKLKKQNELLKRVISESKSTIQRKNDKLRELIAYIRKLHFAIEHLQEGRDIPTKITIAADYVPDGTELPKLVSVYEDVEEEIYDPTTYKGQ